MTEKTYWNGYYDKRAGETVAPVIPSQFAAFVATEFLSEQPTIIEFGCGNGRDSRFFAQHNLKVIGVDSSSSAVETCDREVGGDSTFLCSDIGCDALPSKLQDMLGDAAPLIYARFFIHAIDEATEARFFSIASKLCSDGGAIAVEFRTHRDASFAKVTPAHYRRFVNPIDFIGRAQRAGFRPSYFAEGFGYAKFRDDDAHVARIILNAGAD